MQETEKSSIDRYFNFANSGHDEELKTELGKLSVQELEDITGNTDWWSVLGNDNERWSSVGLIWDLLFDLRKYKLDLSFSYDREIIDRINNLNEKFNNCCIHLKEEIKEAFTRLREKRRSDNGDFRFRLNGDFHVHSHYFEERLYNHPVMSSKQRNNSLDFQINCYDDFSMIDQLPLFDINTNYANKTTNREDIHIGYAFYHYYNNSCLSLWDMLGIDYVRGIYSVTIDVNNIQTPF